MWSLALYPTPEDRDAETLPSAGRSRRCISTVFPDADNALSPDPYALHPRPPLPAFPTSLSGPQAARGYQLLSD